MPLLTIREFQDAAPVFRGRAGNAFARLLMRLLSVDKCNDLYDRNSSLAGPEFAGAVLKDIGVRYEIENSSALESLPDGPFITVSNHPYGGIDGIILVDIFGHLNRRYKVMVNRFLGRVESLAGNFICVTPTGEKRTAPTEESIQGIKDALRHVRGGYPLGIFPSGAVSDLSLKDGCVRDREWQEPVIRLIRRLNVPVMPVTFLEGNSAFYYGLGLLDWKVRLLRLPSEVFNKKGRTVHVAFGNVISPEEQDRCESLDDFGMLLRSSVYDLKTRYGYDK